MNAADARNRKMTSDRCIISVKVGCWEGQLTVILHDEDVSSFVENGMSKGCKFIRDGEMILLYADSDGVEIVAARVGGGGRVEAAPPWTRQFNLTTGEHGQKWDRFALCELEATLDEDGLTIEIPPVYELPWPHVESLHRDDAEDICVREFRRRLRACARDEHAELEVPNRVRRHIPGHAWRRVIEQVKEGLCDGFRIS